MLNYLTSLQEEHLEQENAVLARLNAYIQLEGNVDQSDIFGEPLLIRAMDKHMNRVALKLIEIGADITVEDALGRSAVSYAFSSGSKELMDTYIKAGAELKIAKEHLYDAFESMCYCYRHTDSAEDIRQIEYLLDNSTIDVNACNVSDESFVFFAITTHSPLLVKLFLVRGGNIFVRNKLNMSPLAYADHVLRTIRDFDGSRNMVKLAEAVRALLKEPLKAMA